MSRTLLPRGALSSYSAAVDHVLRVDESTCRAEGVRISSGSFIPPILVGWFRPGGPRRRSARNEGAAAQAGFPRLNPCDPYALQGVPSGDERKIIHVEAEGPAVSPCDFSSQNSELVAPSSELLLPLSLPPATPPSASAQLPRWPQRPSSRTGRARCWSTCR